MATADETSSPMVVPICYVFHDYYFYSPIDEKPKTVCWRELKRVRNILANPRVALVIDDYDEDWTRLAYVVVKGIAGILEPEGEDSTTHGEAVGRLRQKYPQYRSMTIDERPLIWIRPTRIRYWSASG